MTRYPFRPENLQGTEVEQVSHQQSLYFIPNSIYRKVTNVNANYQLFPI